MLKMIKLKKAVLILGLILIAVAILLIYLNNKKDHPVDINKQYREIPKGFGVSIHKGVKDSDIQALADAGFKWARVDVFWSDIEKTKGQYDFESTGYDEINDALKEHDIKPYYILDYENKFYEKNRSITTEEGREAFSKYAEAVVKRYGNQGGIWEIWNEPNTATFWNDQPSESDYTLLVKKVAPVIRKYDSDSIIVAPALAGVSEEALAWLRNVVDRGLLDYIDAVSVHPYQRENPETVIGRYEALRDMLGKDVPIISGEWGYSTTEVTEVQQAEYIARMFLVNSFEKIPISIWYDLKNDGEDPNNREHNFGIISYYSTPKLSFLSIQTLTKVLEGYHFSKRINTGSSNDYILEFLNNDQHKIIVYWTTEDSHHVSIPLDSNSGKSISMLGAVRNVEWKGKKGLNLLTSPTYLIIE